MSVGGHLREVLVTLVRLSTSNIMAGQRQSDGHDSAFRIAFSLEQKGRWCVGPPASGLTDGTSPQYLPKHHTSSEATS